MFFSTLAARVEQSTRERERERKKEREKERVNILQFDAVKGGVVEREDASSRSRCHKQNSVQLSEIKHSDWLKLVT